MYIYLCQCRQIARAAHHSIESGTRKTFLFIPPNADSLDIVRERALNELVFRGRYIRGVCRGQV